MPEDNETENKYVRARRYLDAWIDEGVFIRSDKPGIAAKDVRRDKAEMVDRVFRGTVRRRVR